MEKDKKEKDLIGHDCSCDCGCDCGDDCDCDNYCDCGDDCDCDDYCDCGDDCDCGEGRNCYDDFDSFIDHYHKHQHDKHQHGHQCGHDHYQGPKKGYGCCSDKCSSKTVFGLLILVFGILYLGRNLGWWNFDMNWAVFWPVIVILAGLAIVVKSSKK